MNKAESACQPLLLGYEIAVDNDHPLVMMLVHHFGLVYRHQDRLEDTERMYRRALAGYSRRLGRNHTKLYSVRNGLAELDCQQGKKDDAALITRSCIM